MTHRRRTALYAMGIAGVTSRMLGRESLFAPDDGGGGGGGGSEKTFTQADVDRIVQERVGKLKDQLKASEGLAAKLAEIEAKLAEADERETKAREEAELKGKTELEKLQIQLQKATDKSKLAESEWTKRLAEATAAAEAASGRHVEYVKRHLVTSALNDAGLAKGAGKAAALAFLTEAQLELDENHEIKSVAVAGKSFPKIGEAAAQFLTDNPYFKGPGPGGSGTPRNGNGAPGGNALEQHTSVESLIGAGLAQRAQSA